MSVRRATRQFVPGLSCGPICWGVITAISTALDIGKLMGLWEKPKFQGSLKPRPRAPMSETLGMPGGWSPKAGALGDILGIGTAGCEFGACGPGPSSLTPGQVAQLGGPILPPTWLFTFLGRFLDDPLGTYPLNGNILPYTRPQDGVCTTGPFAPSMNGNPAILKCCQAHDNCYEKNSCNVTSWSPVGGFAFGKCKACNATVVGCIGGAVTK